MIIFSFFVWAVLVYMFAYMGEFWASYYMLSVTLLYVIFISRGKNIVFCLAAAFLTALAPVLCSKILAFFNATKNDIQDLTLLTMIVMPIVGSMIIYEKKKIQEK